MGPRLIFTATLFACGLSLVACGHSQSAIAGTPWDWSSQLASRQAARVSTAAVTTLSPAGMRDSQDQRSVVLAQAIVGESSPTVVEMD